VNTDFAEDIIKACCVLHNFVREQDGYNFEHTLTDELNSLQQQENVQDGVAANTIRDNFSTYFKIDIGTILLIIINLYLVIILSCTYSKFTYNFISYIFCESDFTINFRLI